MEEETLKAEKIEAFEQAMEKEAGMMVHNRNITVPAPGMKLRRHPIDELRETHKLSGKWLVEELGRILTKQSSLPASQRHLIQMMAITVRLKMNAKVKQ